MENVLAVLFLISAIFYFIQYRIQSKRSVSTKHSSLSAVVFFVGLAYAAWQGFEKVLLFYFLFPLLGVVVIIMQWREEDSPRWLSVLLLVIHLAQLYGVLVVWKEQ